ncbi:MAG: hypothetical protein JXB08_00540 [Bacilli bacterium]|nr:hypothetical protein [Bacilli bacterium]
MKEFFRKVFNTEFLPMSEVRKIKVWLVIVFLMVMTVISIPYSTFFVYSVAMKIITISLLFVFLAVMFLLVHFGKTWAAMQVSIIYSIALMLYYTQGVNSFYAYLFFYIALSIIIFYQELFSYLLYGTIVAGLGAYYTVVFKAGLVIANDIVGSEYIFVVMLVMFYIINLIHILHNEKIYTDLNYEWVKMNHIIGKYQDDILYYLEDIRQDAHQSPIYENLEFQKAAFELSQFIAEQIMKDGKEIVNLMDLYVYIHEKGLNQIIDNPEISVAMKKTSNLLGKYLLNENTDMFNMLINFYIQFEDTGRYQKDRYCYLVEEISEYREEQIIGFCLIYRALAREIEKNREWNRLDRSSDSDQTAEVLPINELEEFFSPQVIAFYNDNYEMIKEYLNQTK